MFYVELMDDNLEIYRREFSTELELYKFLWEGLVGQLLTRLNSELVIGSN